MPDNLRLHTQVHSRALAQDRDLIVFLPPGYNDAERRRYPVCYLHDGQNLFDPATAFLNVHWGLGEVAFDLIASRSIEPLIIVGIYNAGVRRQEEYAHVPGANVERALADHYGRAIMGEFKPLIDREYRTFPGSGTTALGGSSLGGLVSTYLGLNFPDVFGKLILMSPSVWWANRDILQRVRIHNPGQKIWLDMGTREGPDPEKGIGDARSLRDALLTAGWTLGRDLMYEEEEGGEHNERAWGRRIARALRFLFPYSDKLMGTSSKR